MKILKILNLIGAICWLYLAYKYLKTDLVSAIACAGCMFWMLDKLF